MGILFTPCSCYYQTLLLYMHALADDAGVSFKINEKLLCVDQLINTFNRTVRDQEELLVSLKQ